MRRGLVLVLVLILVLVVVVVVVRNTDYRHAVARLLEVYRWECSLVDSRRRCWRASNLVVRTVVRGSVMCLCVCR